MKNPRIVIIGDGIAGLTAARHIRRLNQNAKVTVIGAESVPLYSACALPDYLHGYQDRDGVFVPPFPELSKVKVIKNQIVDKIDREIQRVHMGDEYIDYDRLILATGSNAVVPPVPGAKIPGNFTLKTLGDVERIMDWGGHSAVVIGSGAIGVETSMALRARGLRVTLIEMVDRIMPTAFDSAASQILQNSLEKHEINVLVNEKVLGVEGTEKVRGVMSTRGSIDCELIVWAAGVRPNTSLAQDAGIQIGNFRGIKVDDQMRTSDPRIFACGDCIETWEQVLGKPALSLLWGSAKEQAEVAARNALGMEKCYPGALGVMIEEIGGQLAVATGYTESALVDIPHRVQEDQNNLGYYKVIYNDEKILGFQMIGNTVGSGAVISWIKKGANPKKILEILNDPKSLQSAPWYGAAARVFRKELSSLRG